MGSKKERETWAERKTERAGSNDWNPPQSMGEPVNDRLGTKTDEDRAINAGRVTDR
jgi:hypothetical protein